MKYVRRLVAGAGGATLAIGSSYITQTTTLAARQQQLGQASLVEAAWCRPTPQASARSNSQQLLLPLLLNEASGMVRLTVATSSCFRNLCLQYRITQNIARTVGPFVG